MVLNFPAAKLGTKARKKNGRTKFHLKHGT
jgi:hypothetical protein